MAYFLRIKARQAIHILDLIVTAPVVFVAYIYVCFKDKGIIGSFRCWRDSVLEKYRDYFHGYADLHPQFIYGDGGSKMLFEYRLSVGLYGNHNCFMPFSACSADRLITTLNNFISEPGRKLFKLQIDYGGMYQDSLLNKKQAQTVVDQYKKLISEYQVYEETA